MSLSKEKIDTNLYSRQLMTYGMDTMNKIIKMKILIIGLRGLGVETSKNIILTGVNEVQIYDSELVKINDLCGNFFLTEADVGKKRRDEACLFKLSELNSDVKISIMKGDIIENITKFNVIVITEIMEKEKLIEIDEICRKNKIAFIYASILGLSGFVFDDFGSEHVVYDDNGEECKSYIVKIISNDGYVILDDSLYSKMDFLGDDDFVIFREVRGMTELNDGKPRKIKIISYNSFKIIGEDLSKYKEYTEGGIVEQVKLPKNYYYKSLKERFETYFDEKPMEPFDASKKGRNELLFITFLAIHEYFSKNKALPNLNRKTQIEPIVKRTKELYDNNIKLVKEGKLNWFSGIQAWDEKVPTQVASWSRSQISPVCAFLGGIVSQEIIKFTGKYIPINQWLIFDFFETVTNLGGKIDRIIKNGRYDDQIAIFGNEIQKKIEETNIFLIGAGSLGCEFLKNLALMGICSKKGKKLIITDNDNIKLNNLNTQFLFKKTDIGNSKSKCACKEIKKINPSCNARDIQLEVCSKNKQIFNENFWNEQTFIIDAVDNIQTRNYIDNQCTLYGKCHIDSGILGTKGHVQMIVPYTTYCYCDSHDPPYEQFPESKMHNLPVCIENCFEYAMNNFKDYFIEVIKDTKKFLGDKSQFNSNSFQLPKLKFIQKHLVLASVQNIDKIIEFAVMQYTENFQYKIQQLLFNYPEDYINRDGTKFWSGSKILPHPITYNCKDELSFLFVKSYTKILSRSLSIKGDLSDNNIKEISSKILIPNFESYQLKNKRIKDDDIDNELFSLKKELNIYDKNKIDPNKIHPEVFDYDDDNNGHIDFIHAFSNLRARNYNIRECDKLKTKRFFGKIIPKIVNTSSTIAGLASLQLYTLHQTNKRDFLRDCYLNLGINSIIMTEPKEVIHMKDKDNDPILMGPVKAIPPNWTVWDKIIINKSMTCQELIYFIMEKYKVEVSIITAGNVTIIQTFMPSSKERLSQKIEDIYNNYSNIKLKESDKYLFLEISGDIGDVTALMPMFKYIFKN